MLADVAQDRLLSQALRLLGSVYRPDEDELPPAGDISPDEWLDRIETEMGLIIEDTYHRYQMAVEGLAAVQSGASTDETEAVIRAVERKPEHQIRGGRI